jgi:redox-sensing transcriptional repressor
VISDKTVGRLALYRRILSQAATQNMSFIHSHELAARAGVTAAQVRRDLMVIGRPGSPNKGYPVRELLEAIIKFLSGPEGQRLALVGVGNLGQALLSYFVGGRSHLTVVAAFDADDKKSGRVICGCRCYPIQDLESVLREQGIYLGIIAVPAANAQSAAEMLVKAGVRGIINFAPTPLQVPVEVHVENVDLTMSLEKVAFFARERR